jgi:hypothetical protein|tara:strand:- start:300 stop:1127 length:828 start_codon:yes stop_codon:yes gene_type:complete
MKNITLNLYDDHCTKNTRCRHFALLFMFHNYLFTDDTNENFYGDKYTEFCKLPEFPGHFVSFNKNNPRHPSAIIDFEKYNTFNDYFEKLPSNVVRDFDISKNKKYIFEEFTYKNYIPDICEINKSTLKRKSKLNKYYLRTVEEMGGYPKIEAPIENPACSLHNTRWYGVFRYLKKYKQGSIETNKKLIAYCGVARDGELSCVTFLFGHTDYLRDGVMFYLLINIIKSLSRLKNKPRCLQYWSLSSALEKGGLVPWKKRMLFEPANLFANKIGGLV